MGIFTNTSSFDQDVERATLETSTSEEWGLILDICDRAGASPTAARGCLRAALRRLAHPDPHVQVLAATLLDACVANCGRAFLLEVASRDFEQEFRRLLARAQPPVQARLRALLRKWAEGEFRDDPALDLIPSLHAKLSRDAAAAPAPTPAPAPAPAPADDAREQDELARAIALSLRETAPAPSPAAPGPAPAPSPAAPLYPRVAEEARRVRALYDFEAAEDNELTFSAGEIVHVTDASDPNWWKGYNSRGEGLFPANFVTSDAAPEEAAGGAAVGAAGGAAEVAAPAEEEAVAAIDARAIDAALAALLEADPCAEGGAGGAGAGGAVGREEARALASGALVDAALERADTRHARLTQLSAELVDALNLYHDLMRAPHPLPHPLPQPHPALPPHAYYPR